MTCFEEIQAAAAIAQILVAVIAVYYTARTAFATTQAGRDTVFLQSTVASLNEVVQRARTVRLAYRGMFVKFANVKEKADLRATWLRQREEVGVLLGELAELEPKLAPVLKAWKVLEQEEDTHATGDTLTPPAFAATNAAHERYDVEHNRFIKCMGEVLRSMR